MPIHGKLFGGDKRKRIAADIEANSIRKRNAERKSLLARDEANKADLVRRGESSARVNLAGLRSTNPLSKLTARDEPLLGPTNINSTQSLGGPTNISALSTPGPTNISATNSAQTSTDIERQRKIEQGQATDLAAAKKRKGSALASLDSFRASQERQQKSLLR